MLSSSRTILGILLLGVLAVIVWSLLSGVRPLSRPAPKATTTPIVTEKPKPTVPESQGEAPLSARVSVETPKAGATVGKTFAVEGMAPGNWYFEASFPIQVRDKDGAVLGRAIAQAQSDWMTTELVAFKTTVTLDTAYVGSATLILLRDNPSGLPENDDALEIAIVIK